MVPERKNSNSGENFRPLVQVKLIFQWFWEKATFKALVDDFEEKDIKNRKWFPLEEAQRILGPSRPFQAKCLEALKSSWLMIRFTEFYIVTKYI